MNLIESPQNIIIKKTLIPSGITVSELAKQFDLIEIKPTRRENILIDLLYPSIKNIPQQFNVNFFDSDLTQYSSSDYYTSDLIPLESEDKQTKGIRILDTSFGPLVRKPDSIVKFIGISSEENSFECFVDVHKKFTYQIYFKNKTEEFWYPPDGNKHHEVGDTIIYNDDIRLAVMDIDEEKWIAKCAVWEKK